MNATLEITKRLPQPIVTGLLKLRLNPLIRPAMDWVASRMKRKDAVIQRGVGRGLKFNPGGSNAGYVLGLIEPDVQRAFELRIRPGMTVFDVGANVGFMTTIAARLVGTAGRVVAFEPVPALANQVMYNARLNGFQNVTVLNVALSDSDGESAFTLSENLTMGRLAGAEQSSGANLRVKVCRLDTLVKREGLPDPDLVKVDVEGAEGAMLDGASEILRRCRPVVLIELHGTNEAVGRRLDALEYLGQSLQEGRPVEDAAPNAYVLAVPREPRRS